MWNATQSRLKKVGRVDRIDVQTYNVVQSLQRMTQKIYVTNLIVPRNNMMQKKTNSLTTIRFSNKNFRLYWYENVENKYKPSCYEWVGDSDDGIFIFFCTKIIQSKLV